MKIEKPKLEPLLIGVDDLAAMLNISRAKLYAALSSGAVGVMPVRSLGRRTLFIKSEVESWVKAGLPNRDRWIELKKHTA